MDGMDDEPKLSLAKEKSFINMQTQIPSAWKDMTDLKKDWRKRNLQEILKAWSNWLQMQIQISEAMNNQFGTKVKFE
mgnify:CR=1 FL=1